MKKTRIALLVLALLALALEGWAIYSDDWALITTVVRDLPAAIVFGLGFLCGHFFWCDCNEEDKG